MIREKSGVSESSAETSFEPGNLVELLRWRAARQPESPAYTFLEDGEGKELNLTYHEVDRRARAIGAHLQEVGASGERVLLVQPPGLDYVVAFFGCLYAGAVAVPVYPPRQNRTLSRLQAVVFDAQARFALTTREVLARSKPSGQQGFNWDEGQWIVTEEVGDQMADRWQPPAIDGDTLAFLQYTSGSTSEPKGVMVSHNNLLANERLIKTACRHTERSTFVGWLPFYHDMGLIGNVLQPLYLGSRSILMSPAAFLQEPFRWLQAISRYRAATSGGPNFAYDLCVRQISQERAASLDLSCWTTAFNGAEPIRHASLERFAAAFKIAGFRRDAFFPCYGLAEATLLASGASRLRPHHLSVSSKALERNQVVPPTDDREATVLVSSGRAWLDQEVVIVDPETRLPLGPGAIGEIWLSGPCVAQGYWRRAEETAQTFQARLANDEDRPFLRTGDLGFLLDGELFVTGRLKDLIIIRGRNLYPQDIELTVQECHPALRPNAGAAFQVEVAGEEQLVIVQEIDRHHPDDLDALLADTFRKVAEEHEVQVHAIALIKPGSLPKTSSGKVQRRATRAKFLDNSLDMIAARAERAAAPEEAPPLRPAENLADWLRSQLAAKLKVAPAEIDPRRPLIQYGLDSLTAIDLMHGVQKGLGVRLPMVEFFHRSTLDELVSLVGKLMADAADSRDAGRAQRRAASYPLAHGQQALWFLYQMARDNTAYNIPIALRVRAALDVGRFQRAVQSLVDRHACLRTTVGEIEGIPYQHVQKSLPASIRREDASSWPEDVLEERLAEEAERRFDLESGPLLRVLLLGRAEDDFILLLSVHHIIADLWSLELLLRELDVLYRAEAAGELPAVTTEYADYVGWQAETLASPEGEAHWSYWRERLSGELAPLALPADRPRPPVQTYRGASVSFEIGAEQTRQLKELGRAHGCTLFTVLLAAFKVLLYRYTDQKDILVGTPTTGRSLAEFRDVVGYFVNPVVLRSAMDGGQSFAAFLEGLRETVLDGFAHQDYPFVELVKRLQPSRDLSTSPLFQVMFVLQQSSAFQGGGAAIALGEAGAGMRLGDLELETVRLNRRAALFDLTLMMAEGGQGLKGSAQYNSDLFDARTIERLAGSFQVLLEGILSRPGQRLSGLPILGQAERRQLLVEWNQTATTDVADRCVQELFEEQCERTPEATALVCDGQHLTYRALDRHANQLARYLRELGAGQEALVGICLERSADMIVAILAALKAGAAYLPLDPAYPKQRLEFILEDTQAPVLLTQRQLLDIVPAYSGTTVCLDTQWQEVAKQSAERLRNEARPDSIAYVIYTSGSTGRPKGVAIEHHSTVAFLQWAHRQFTPRQLAVVLASTSICFDLAVFEMFAPLTCGGMVLLAENALQLPALRAAHHVTLVNTVPSAMTELMRLKGVPPNVETVNLAGEPLSEILVGQVYAQATITQLYNLYGPTEYTTYTTGALMTRDAAVTIGRPIANTQVYILDENLEPVPVGVPGEVYIGGAGLARGYLKRPSLTAERFIPDPHGIETDARLYKTGDLARYLPEGDIDYIGRVDNQVKVRGYRIELGEVEAALRLHPDLLDAAVIAAHDQQGEPLLAAYLVARAPSPPSLPALRAHLKLRLPDFMLPQRWLWLDRLPLTPNGKLDRRALPAPAAAATPAASTAGAGAAGPAQQLVAATFAEVLGLTEVGPDENFFELGGHSLLASRVAARLRAACGVEVELREVFERPTAAELGAAVERRLRGGQAEVAAAVAKAERVGPLPLSFAQLRLWFLDQLEPNTSTFNVPVALRLTGRLDLSALQPGLNEILRRHESLRANFISTDGVPTLIISPAAELALKVIDLRQRHEAELESEATRLTNEEARTPFDLTADLLVRASLLRLREDESILLITLHHIVADGWSAGIFFAELAECYRAFLADRPPALSELPIQYVDYAMWQRRQLDEGAMQGQLDYWKNQLAGELPRLDLPADFARPTADRLNTARQHLVIAEELSMTLNSLSRREGATLFMVLLAAFKVLLHRYTNQTDILVGAPIAGRNRPEVEGLIGMFLNTLAFRTRLSAEMSFRELLHGVREMTLGAYAHQNLPFERILEELQRGQDATQSPLFQVFFNYLSFPRPDIQLPGLAAEFLPSPEIGAKFDLTLYVEHLDKKIQLIAVYDADLFSEPRVSELLAQFEYLLSQVADDPNRPLGDYSLVTPRAQAIWPDPRQNLGMDWRGGVPAVFSEQARRVPTRPAVIDGDEVYSYKQLDELSNQLASRLLARGIGPQEVVAIYADRCAGLVLALLGTLKSGAAFVILDPKHPPARLLSYLRLARPRGWIQIEGTGELPDSFNDFLRGPDLCASLRLPAHSLKASETLLQDQPIDYPRVTLRPDDLAYVAFTSGSTGEPKAIAGLHGPLAQFVPWLATRFDLSERDRFSMLSGLSHDPLHRDVFLPLQLGACVCVPEAEDLGAPGCISRWMKWAAITVANLTPAMERLITNTDGEDAGDHIIESLRCAFFVGERLTRRNVERMGRVAPAATCINFYGATETQQALSFYVVPNELLRRDTLPVGRGIKDVQLLVLNAAGQLAGVGEVGEICFRSPHLARGYLADNELTRARFTINPFTSQSDDRLYRSGDFGRYLPDGQVEILGRADDQVKVRGYRIELGEVEAALRLHPDLLDAAVIAAHDQQGEPLLAAYLVARAPSPPSLPALRAHLKLRLPDFMLPQRWLWLDRLPLTPNGKLDRRALPAPAAAATPAASTAGAGAAGPAQQLVAATFAEVLGLTEVGPDENFFELGGHSLLASRVAARLRAACGVEVELREVFERPTASELGAAVERRLRGGQAEVAAVVAKAERVGPLPLSFAQLRLWFLDQFDEGASSAYNVAGAFRLSGQLDRAVLERALNEVIRRHEILRTRFVASDGSPVQIIDAAQPLTLATEDLRHLPRPQRENLARERATAELRAPFNLADGPLLRVRLYRLEEGEHIFLLTLHHIICDGGSIRVLAHELTALYEAYTQGEASPLPEPDIQYADYALWQREWVKSGRFDRQMEYWKQQLAGRPTVLELPATRALPDPLTFLSAQQTFTLSAELTEQIKALSRRESVTVFMTLLAAFQVLLRDYTGEEDFIIGSNISNQAVPGAEELIGLFVNNLALRADLSGGLTFSDLLRRVRRTCLDAYAHQDLPFEKLVEELQPRRQFGKNPLFQILFALQSFADTPIELPAGLTLSPLDIDGGMAPFDVILNMTEVGGSLSGVLKYNRDLYTADSMADLLDAYQAVLGRAIHHPQLEIEDLLVVREERDRQLIRAFNED